MCFYFIYFSSRQIIYYCRVIDLVGAIILLLPPFIIQPPSCRGSREMNLNKGRE